MAFAYAPFPVHPDYEEALRVRDASLARLARDCTACAADYVAVSVAFTAALRALPDLRMKRSPEHWKLEDEMPRTRESVRHVAD